MVFCDLGGACAHVLLWLGRGAAGEGRGGAHNMHPRLLERRVVLLLVRLLVLLLPCVLILLLLCTTAV